MIKAIIFDYDGVLADTEMAIFSVNRKILETFGKDASMSFDEYKKQITNWKDMYLRLGFTPEEMERVPDVFLAEIMKLTKDIRFFDGIEDMVKALHKKFKLAIVSNGDGRRIRHQLDAHGMEKYFDAILDLTAEKHKPDPHQMLVCMEALGVMPDETCVVGDSTDDI